MTYEVWHNGQKLSEEVAYSRGQQRDPDTGEVIGYGFELLDVELAEGENTIKVTLTDRAGNTATAEAVYTFTTAGDDTAPEITVYWPGDGARINGDEFTVRGSVDDQSASVQAQWRGMTYDWVVERSGLFWIDDLPFATSEGNNQILITAVDAAGNTSTHELTVAKSDLGLDIYDVAEGDYRLTKVTEVSGRINSNAYAVWVNGVKVDPTTFEQKTNPETGEDQLNLHDSMANLT